MTRLSVPGLWPEQAWGPGRRWADTQRPGSRGCGKQCGPCPLRAGSLRLLTGRKGHPKLWRGSHGEGGKEALIW